MKCIIQAWHQNENELRNWLMSKLKSPSEADDLLQTIFENAMLHREIFCSLKNARAWLFKVARNTLIDRYRLKKNLVELEENMPIDESATFAVDELSQCIPRVLSELSKEDQEIITQCDLEGVSQQTYANNYNISLSAAKSRIQRARKRFRQTLEKNCQVRKDDTGNVCCFTPRPLLK